MSSQPFRLELGDCVELMKGLPDASIDVVLTDPPYGYLKHKLDRPFDEAAYFDQVDRILRDTGFHVTFGRGSSFYGWNVQLASRGFKFKEEVIWNKRMPSGPCAPLLRFHETVSIYAKKRGTIRQAVIPYEEMRAADPIKIQEDLRSLVSGLKSEATFANLQEFVRAYEETGKAPIPVYEDEVLASKHAITVKTVLKRNKLDAGALKNIAFGMRERSIMTVTRDHYNEEHPTQKPVRLMERILMLVSDIGDSVLDPFMGSGSTGIACVVQERQFTGFEILKEYYDLACRRVWGAVGMEKPEPMSWIFV